MTIRVQTISRKVFAAPPTELMQNNVRVMRCSNLGNVLVIYSKRLFWTRDQYGVTLHSSSYLLCLARFTRLGFSEHCRLQVLQVLALGGKEASSPLLKGPRGINII